LSIAFASACELEYHLLLAHDLGYLADRDHTDTDAAVKEVKRMLSGLIDRATPRFAS
jgi:four helix bundle protein